jgi:hypothetical protein
MHARFDHLQRAGLQNFCRPCASDSLMKRALPVFERFRIRKPCPLKWEDMVGDAKTRFCAVCNKNVHDLGGRTHEEAEELIASGNACVRTSMRAAIPAAAVVAAATVVFTLTAACSGAVDQEPEPTVGPQPAPTTQTVGDADGGPQEIHLMGEIVIDEPPTVGH